MSFSEREAQLSTPASSASADTIGLASGDLAYDLLRVVDAAGDGLLVLDREWRIIFANESARRISRIQPEHLNGPSHWELFPATVGTEQERVYRRVMEERVSLDSEVYYPPYDLWIALLAVPVADGIAVHYRDVTQLKKTEMSCNRITGQLQQVFEATTDAIVLFDRDYNFTFLNRRAREILAPSGELMGMHLWTCFPAAFYEGSPHVEAYQRAMDERVASCFEAFYPEPLNLWLAIEAHPADDGIIVFFRDLTEQRAAREELHRKSEEAERQAAEIEAVYRTAPIGLALFDPVEFRYLRLNERQASFFGLRPEQVLGRSLTEMAPIEGLRELFEQVLAGTPVVNFPLEGAVVSNPNEHRYWTVNYFPVFGPDGSIQGISAASLEVTQQKRAERALIESEKLAAAGRLASSISHEINNPLESVVNLLYLLEMTEDMPEVARSYVQMAQEELTRVSHIVTQTLRFYRQTSRPMRITAAQVVQPVIELFRRRLVNAKIEVETHLPSTAGFCCLEGEIRQVLSNLISNAIDALPAGGRVVFHARDAVEHPSGRRGVRISVADNGAGMTSAVRARIFEPFYTTKELNGTGLGLWISTEIVARHKGTLTVRSSRHPRRHGTVFSLFLPLNPECVIESATTQGTAAHLS